MASARVILFLACLACLDLLSLQQNAVMVAADVHIGSCVWGAVNYTSNCNKECQRRGYKGGHCGSFANVNCWCEKK